MYKIIEELDKLGKEIEQSKTRKAQLEGKREQQMEVIKSLGISSSSEGKKMLSIYESKAAKLKEQIEKEFASLKEKYEW